MIPSKPNSKTITQKKQESKIKSPSLYDTTAANILNELSSAYWYSNPDKAQDYVEQCLTVSEQIGFKKGIGRAYYGMGIILNVNGDNLASLVYYEKALKIGEEVGIQIILQILITTSEWFMQTREITPKR
ncbi:MAG: tetratricopeptide repeat protein [Bacteroidetes bacterium]|nr:tetratricopeptide repeat protein [Bacteroidota bacterium]